MRAIHDIIKNEKICLKLQITKKRWVKLATNVEQKSRKQNRSRSVAIPIQYTNQVHKTEKLHLLLGPFLPWVILSCQQQIVLDSAFLREHCSPASETKGHKYSIMMYKYPKEMENKSGWEQKKNSDQTKHKNNF